MTYARFGMRDVTTSRPCESVGNVCVTDPLYNSPTPASKVLSRARMCVRDNGVSRRIAKGVRANVVSPGTTYFKGGFWHKVEVDEPAMFADVMKRNPTGRMATPEDIANAVAFVASPAAGFILGANIVVDGGFTHRIQN